MIARKSIPGIFKLVLGESKKEAGGLSSVSLGCVAALGLGAVANPCTAILGLSALRLERVLFLRLSCFTALGEAASEKRSHFFSVSGEGEAACLGLEAGLCAVDLMVQSP